MRQEQIKANKHKANLSKSEKGLTANVCCLSSLYPCVVATASSASRTDWNSRKQYLPMEQLRSQMSWNDRRNSGYKRKNYDPVCKTKSWCISKRTWKLKHANFTLESFEHCFKISSKSILIILSYTVSKLVRFLRQRSVRLRHSS